MRDDVLPSSEFEATQLPFDDRLLFPFLPDEDAPERSGLDAQGRPDASRAYPAALSKTSSALHVLVAAADVGTYQLEDHAMLAFARPERQFGEIDRLYFDLPGPTDTTPRLLDGTLNRLGIDLRAESTGELAVTISRLARNAKRG